MAGKTGLDKLREYAKTEYCHTEDSDGRVLSVTCGRYMSGKQLNALADQIEAESEVELKAVRDDCDVAIKAADHARKMTDEAQRVVERLRVLDSSHFGCSQSETHMFRDEVGKAVGVGSPPDGRYSTRTAEIVERLANLIEHGSTQDVDVVALQDAKREAAANWVETHGGLEEIKHHYAFMVDQVAKRVDVEPSADEPEHVTIGKIIAELDKRLMPCDLTWPTWSDGLPITRDDAPEDVSVICLSLDGQSYAMYHHIPSDVIHGRTTATGERVKRPEPDTQGRLDADAKAFCCKCIQYDCEHGTTPYGDIPSLLRRQRELCAKGGVK